jgi:nitrogen regulatory protein PII
MQTHHRKKVEIVVEAVQAPRMVAMIQKAGAKGYTVIPNVSGKGQRGVRGDGDIVNVFQNVLIVTITTDEVAARIVEEANRLLENYAGIVSLSDVEVIREDHF